MPLLSATNAIEPALEQAKSMLFRPFRFKTWLKIGFIGWLAGGASGGFNINVPSFPGGSGSSEGGDVAQNVRVWLHEHILLIVLIAVVAMIMALLLMYVSCRFRFILFDSIVNKDANIGRGWKRYGAQALRYFGFLLSFIFIFFTAVVLIVALPIWHAFSRGTLGGNDPMAILRVVLLILLGAFVFIVAGAIIMSLANDFGVPLVALDDMSVGDAWRALKHMVSAEPWAYAGYLGMKFVLSIAAGLAVAIPFIIGLVILLIPGVILVLLGVAIAKALGPVAAIALAAIGGLVGFTLLLMLTLLATAPVTVFFTSYSLHFFGGRYPKLGALLWPEPPAPAAPPLLVPPPPVPGMGSIG